MYMACASHEAMMAIRLIIGETSPWCVLKNKQACEYVDSFLEFAPKIEIILNIDSDHLDYFKDIDHIKDSYMDMM